MTEQFNIQDLKSIHDHIVVQEMNFDARVLSSGIVLLNDDKKTAGIRPRWAKVCMVGPEQNYVSVGQWVLVEHGRWTRGITVPSDDGYAIIRRVDPDCILAVSDEQPLDENISTAVQAQAKTFS
jgi:hypothetical protein